MWDCYSLEVLKLEGSLCSQALQGSVDFPILAKGNEGCSTPTPGGRSPLMITQSFDLCPKSVLLLDQWHQGTDTWPECWCCVSSSTQDIAIPFWTWGRPGDGSKMSPERVWRGNAVPDSIKVHKGDQKWGSLPFPSLPFSSGHRAHLTCTEQDYGIPLSGQFLQRAENSTPQKEKHILHYKGKDSQKTSQYHHVAASSKWTGAKSVPKCLG